MATEKRLKDANVLKAIFDKRYDDAFMQSHTRPNIAWWEGYSAGVNWGRNTIEDAPTVDAVPVDEVRVDIMSLCLANQEAILNVSICGKPNEVKLPFSKEVAEVVHGQWRNEFVKGIRGVFGEVFVCSECKTRYLIPNMNYCPNCGAKMDGDGNG